MDILSYLLSKKYTDSVVSQIANFEMHVLDTLPETGQSNIFYAIPSVDEVNTYDLYIWAANISDFKKVGTTKADLTNYYTKQEVDSLISNIDVDFTGYATEDWVKAAIENIDLSDYAEKTSLAKVATSGSYDDLTNKPQLFDGDYNSLKNQPIIPSIDGLATEGYVDETIANIEIPEAEIYKVDFNNPNYIDARAAYESGKLLVLINAAPDIDSYALINSVSENHITFTKFSTNGNEAYGTFNTYYLNSTNTWEVSKEVRLNKVEANPSEESTGELNKVRIGKEIFTIPQAPSLAGYATEEFVKQKILEAEIADKEADLEAYYTKSEVNALIPEVPTKISELENDTNYTNETKVLELIQNNANTKIGIDFVTDITVGHLSAGTEIKADMTFSQLVYKMLFAGSQPGEPEEPVGIKYLSGTFGNSDDEIQEWPEPWIADWSAEQQAEISTHYVNNMIENTVASEEDLIGRHGFAITTPFVKESQSLANYGDTSTDPYTTKPAIVLPIGYQVTAWNTDPDNSPLSECTLYSYTLTDGRTVYYAADFPQQTGTTVTHYLTIVKN